jgi:circadian clock protein KaiC
MQQTTHAGSLSRSVSSGIPGLDTVLGGGYIPSRLYLIEGEPGAGKTTLALQFLLDGLRRGETVLYVTLSETAEELHEVAASHGWSLDGAHIHEVVPGEEQFDPSEQYTVFHPSEVELAAATRRLLEQVEELKPTRLVFDSMAELRLLAGSALQFRRQVLALKQFLTGRACTVLLLDDTVAADHGLHVQTIVHGVVHLEQVASSFGPDRRRLRVRKFRGRRFIEGTHDYVIRTGGLQVFPRLIAADQAATEGRSLLATGHAQLDALLGGGIDEGSSTLLVGAAGTGKSSLATFFATVAAERGERAAMFLFDESIRSLVKRSEGLGFDIQRHVDAGRIELRTVDPAQLSPGEFFQLVRDAVEQRGCCVVVIDSLNSFMSAMPGEEYLTVMLHELLTYLGMRGVTTFMINAQLGLIGTMTNSIDVSYLADNVVMLRYFEAHGEVRQAISVLKKRMGNHERTIRDIVQSSRGIEIGEPLRQFRGVLTGVPHVVSTDGGAAKE